MVKIKDWAMLNRFKEAAQKTKAFQPQFLASIDMLEIVLLRLRLWSLLVLPVAGYLLGKILQYVFQTKSAPYYESLLVHALTMVFMITTFNDILFSGNPETAMTNIKDKALFVCLAYLFVLGTVLGIIV